MLVLEGDPDSLHVLSKVTSSESIKMQAEEEEGVLWRGHGSLPECLLSKVMVFAELHAFQDLDFSSECMHLGPDLIHAPLPLIHACKNQYLIHAYENQYLIHAYEKQH